MTPESIIKTIREYKDSDAENKKPLTSEELEAVVNMFTSIINAKQKK